MQPNNHNKPVPDTVIAAAETALDAQLQAFASYATPLTPDDRRSLLKMGPKTFKFVELAHTLAGQNSQLTSKAFDMKDFTEDWHDAQGLLGLENRMRQLLEMIEDIRTVAGSDAHHHALEFYADVKAEAARNIPEAHAVYEQLKAAYPKIGRRHRKTEDSQT
jgi:hypothetical protein